MRGCEVKCEDHGMRSRPGEVPRDALGPPGHVELNNPNCLAPSVLPFLS
jgi:hypothetical protein